MALLGGWARKRCRKTSRACSAHGPVDPAGHQAHSKHEPVLRTEQQEAVAKPWAGAGAVSECDSSCGLVFCPVRLLEMPPEQGFYG